MTTELTSLELKKEMENQSNDPSFLQKIKTGARKIILPSLLAVMATTSIAPAVASDLSNQLNNNTEISEISSLDSVNFNVLDAKENLSFYNEKEKELIILGGYNLLDSVGKSEITISEAYNAIEHLHYQHLKNGIIDESQNLSDVAKNLDIINHSELKNFNELPQNLQELDFTSEENIVLLERDLNTKTFLNTNFTLDTQKNILTAGFFLTGEMGSLHKVQSTFDSTYTKFLNDNGISSQIYSENDFAKDLISHQNLSVDDTPQYLISSVKTHFPSFDKMTTMEKDQAAIFAKEYSDKPISSLKEAVEFSQEFYAKKIYRDGGLWSNEKLDMVIDFQSLNNGYDKMIESTFSSQRLDDLPQYLRSDSDGSRLVENEIRKTLDIEEVRPSLKEGEVRPVLDLTKDEPKSKRRNRLG